MQIVSKDSAGIQDTRVHSRHGSISSDGNFVVFESESGFFSGENVTRTSSQIFRKNLTTGELDLVTLGVDGEVGDRASTDAIVSADGRLVAFLSHASNLTADGVNPNINTLVKHLYVRDMATGETTLISKNEFNVVSDKSTMSDFAFSPDGTKIAFTVPTGNLFPTVRRNPSLSVGLFVKDLNNDVLIFVEADDVTSIDDDDATAFRSPAFSSTGTKLTYVYSFREESGSQIVVHDLISNLAEVVSTLPSGEIANAAVSAPSFGGADSLVLFISPASNLHPDEHDVSQADAFVKNLATGGLEHVSITNTGAQLNDSVLGASISPDGSRVAFLTGATNIEEPGIALGRQVYVRNRTTSQVQIVAQSHDGTRVDKNASLSRFSFANDNTITFMSRAANLDPIDSRTRDDIFVRRLVGQCIP
ncbi:MAG: hypothetical protein AAFX86_01630 [Pseudomonadota bacterium]